VEAAAALADSLVTRAVRPELSLQLNQPELAIELTDGTRNTDDVSALILTMRTAALRLLGYPQAALDVTKEVLRFPSRARSVRLRARFERACVYVDMEQGAGTN
jgi:hypothetical protein